MYKNYKSFVSSLIISSIALVSIIAVSHAQVEIATPPKHRMSSTTMDKFESGIDIKKACNAFLENLKLRDGTLNSKNGKVKELQDFLIAQGHLNSSSTGMFGEQTKKALEDYQLANGITPSGNLGEMTRELMRRHVCANINNIDFKLKPFATNTPSGTRQIVWNASNTRATGTAYVCTGEYRMCDNGQLMKRDYDCTWREDLCASGYDMEQLKQKREEGKKLREQNLRKLDAEIKKDLKEKKVKYNHMTPQIFKSSDSPSQSFNLVKSAFFDFFSK